MKWTFGDNHSAEQWKKRMQHRGWSESNISEAIDNGQQFPATNLVSPEHGAMRFVHPITGRSVVVDDLTHEVIHLGGDGFVY